MREIVTSALEIGVAANGGPAILGVMHAATPLLMWRVAPRPMVARALLGSVRRPLATTFEI
jgi:hypothetical protein